MRRVNAESGYSGAAAPEPRPPKAERAVYQLALRALNAAGLGYVVGGAIALGHYSGLWRDVQDLDLLVLPSEVDRALDALQAAGFRTWTEESHWLAEASRGTVIVDVIFGSGNLLVPVDQQWLDRGQPALLFGVPTRIAPVEELIWSKAYVASRGRFDGADVVHLLHSTAERLDWDHLLSRFGQHWSLLLAYLCLFRFVYPDRRNAIPRAVLETLIARGRQSPEARAIGPEVCRGPLLDRSSYDFDLAQGYQPPRRVIDSERAPLDRSAPGREAARLDKGEDHA